MARYIKLLPGSRSATNDINNWRGDTFVSICKSGEADIIILDCTRWLEGATISSAAESAGFMSVSIATPNITVTITGADQPQSGDIDITDSTGRSRIVTIQTRAPETFVDDGYGFNGAW